PPSDAHHDAKGANDYAGDASSSKKFARPRTAPLVRARRSLKVGSRPPAARRTVRVFKRMCDTSQPLREETSRYRHGCSNTYASRQTPDAVLGWQKFRHSLQDRH